MIELDSSDSLNAVASAANAVACQVFGNLRTGALAPGGAGITNSFRPLFKGFVPNAAAVLVSAFTQQQIQIKAVQLQETSGADVTVSFLLSGNGAANKLHTMVIPANGSATYEDGYGWRLHNASGVPVAASVALPAQANNTILSNISGATAAPAPNSLSAILDAVVSNAQGTILYRSAATWSALAPGTAGQFLRTAGAAANPTWGSSTTKTVTTPVTGFNSTIANATTPQINYVMTPAGVLATGTLTMPATPLDSQIVAISTCQTITALTLNANAGQTINNAATTLTAGPLGTVRYIYDTASTTWNPA